MSHDHYKKDVSHLDMIDVYRVLELFNVTHPALQHAAKKILAAGGRGAKDWEKDVQEAIDSLNRALQMREEDDKCNATMLDTAHDANDPHAELRKTWKPGQRWQIYIPTDGRWGNIPFNLCPLWIPQVQYRRHPDDK